MSSRVVSVSASVDGCLRVVGEEFALLERCEDGVAAFVEFGELLEAVADGGDGDFVEGAGGFLAVAGDEGDGGAFGEELGGGLDLGGRRLSSW